MGAHVHRDGATRPLLHDDAAPCLASCSTKLRRPSISRYVASCRNQTWRIPENMLAELAKWWSRIGNPAAVSPLRYRVYTTEFDRIIHGDELPARFGPEHEATLQVKASEVDPVLSRWRAAAEPAAVEAARAHA